MSACQHGVPIFISWPHFLDADPIYLKPFNGLKPNRTRHQTYVDIEPVTGTPVDFIARIQVNVEVNTSQVSRISHNNMKSMIFPTLWQEFSIHITDKMAHTIVSQTETPRIVSFSIATLVLVIGISFVLYATFLIFSNFHRKLLSKQQTPLLSDQDINVIDQDDSANNNNIING